MAGIGIIANPHSKLNKRNPQRQYLLSYIAGKKGRFEITNNLAELKKVACEFRNQGVTLLAINGGDGTISRTLTAFVHAYQDLPLPTIALLRGGTMNMLADNLGVKGSPEQILFSLIEAHSLEQDLPTVTLNTLKIADHYGFLFANGTSARFLQEFYKNKSGTFGVFRLVASLALSSLVKGRHFARIVHSEKVSLNLANPDQGIEHESLSVFCATVCKLPLGSRLFPDAQSHPQQFQTLSITYRADELVAKLIPAFLLQPQKPSHGKISFCTSALTLTYPGPQLYTLDGELYTAESGKVEVGLGPRIKFVVL